MEAWDASLDFEDEPRRVTDEAQRGAESQFGRKIGEQLKQAAALLRQSRVQEARALLDQVLKSGHDAARVSALTVLMKYYADRNDMREVEEVMAEVRARGLRPDVVMFSVWLGVLAQRGQSRKALAVYEEMRRSGIQPDEVIFLHMLRCFARTGELEAARRMFQELQQHMRPNRFHWACMVDAHARAGQIEAARAYLQQMEAAGQGPHEVAHAALLHALGRAGRLEEAAQLLEQMRLAGILTRPDTFNGLASALLLADRPVEAARVLDTMRLCGIPPDQITLNTRLSLHARLDQWDEAWEAFQELERLRVLEQQPHQNLPRRLRYDPQHYRRPTTGPDAYSFATLLNLALRLGRLEDAQQVLHRMIDAGLRPECVVLTVYPHRFDQELLHRFHDYATKLGFSLHVPPASELHADEPKHPAGILPQDQDQYQDQDQDSNGYRAERPLTRSTAVPLVAG